MQFSVTTVFNPWNHWFAPSSHLVGSMPWCRSDFLLLLQVCYHCEPIYCVVKLILSLCNCWRLLCFIRLANTPLDNSHANLIAGGLTHNPRAWPGPRASDLGAALDGVTTRSLAHWCQPAPQRPQRTGAALHLIMWSLPRYCNGLQRVERIHCCVWSRESDLLTPTWFTLTGVIKGPFHDRCNRPHTCVVFLASWAFKLRRPKLVGVFLITSRSPVCADFPAPPCSY